MSEKKIVIIGTGGTIAGKASSSTDLVGYQAGALYAEDILNAVPELKPYGPFTIVDFCHIDSSDITLLQWAQLGNIINNWAEKDDVAGIVVMHGTDTMEETSYFLQLTLKTEKPVVLTGAMRPSTGISADGPINLLNAIQTARSPEAYGKGVIVCMNGHLDSARHVTKTHATDVSTFTSGPYGHMGLVHDGEVTFFYAPNKPHTTKSVFSTLSNELLENLPRVDIAYLYAGIEADTISAMLSLHPKGLILAGLGQGVIPKQLLPVISKLSIPIVRTTRTNNGIISPVPQDKEHDFISGYGFTPVKARVLLMLCLCACMEKEQIQEFFKMY